MAEIGDQQICNCVNCKDFLGSIFKLQKNFKFYRTAQWSNLSFASNRWLSSVNPNVPYIIFLSPVILTFPQYVLHIPLSLTLFGLDKRSSLPKGPIRLLSKSSLILQPLHTHAKPPPLLLHSFQTKIYLNQSSSTFCSKSLVLISTTIFHVFPYLIMLTAYVIFDIITIHVNVYVYLRYIKNKTYIE